MCLFERLATESAMTRALDFMYPPETYQPPRLKGRNLHTVTRRRKASNTLITTIVGFYNYRCSSLQTPYQMVDVTRLRYIFLGHMSENR